MNDRTVCETVVRQLWQYLDGTAESDKHAVVESHLEVCVACAAHFDFAREFLDAVAATPSPHGVDPRLRSRVLAALGREGFAAQSGTL